MAATLPKTPRVDGMGVSETERGRRYNATKSVPPKTPAPKSIRSSRTVSAGRKMVTVLPRTPRDLKRAMESDMYAPSPAMGSKSGIRSPLGNITNASGSREFARPAGNIKSPLKATPAAPPLQPVLSASRRKKSMLPPQRLAPADVEDYASLETPSEMLRTLADVLYHNPLPPVMPLTPRRPIESAPARSATRRTPNAVTPRQVQIAQARKAMTPKAISPFLSRATPHTGTTRRRKARETPSDILRMLSRAPDLTPMPEAPIPNKQFRRDSIPLSHPGPQRSRTMPMSHTKIVEETSVEPLQQSKDRPDNLRRSSLANAQAIRTQSDIVDDRVIGREPLKRRSPETVIDDRTLKVIRSNRASPVESVASRRRSESPVLDRDQLRQSIVSARSSLGAEVAREAVLNDQRRSIGGGRPSAGLESLPDDLSDDGGAGVFDPVDDTFASEGLYPDVAGKSLARSPVESTRRISEALSVFGPGESPAGSVGFESPRTNYFTVRRPSPLAIFGKKKTLGRSIFRRPKNRDSGIGLAEKILVSRKKTGSGAETMGAQSTARRSSKRSKPNRVSPAGLPVPTLPVSLLRKVYGTFWQQSHLMRNTRGASRIRHLGQKVTKPRVPRLGREMMDTVEDLTHAYIAQVSEDLGAFADHAGRKTIEMADVILLFKRQGLLPSDLVLSRSGLGAPSGKAVGKSRLSPASSSSLNLTTMSTLARKYLPKELAETVCRAAEKDEVKVENRASVHATKKGRWGQVKNEMMDDDDQLSSDPVQSSPGYRPGRRTATRRRSGGRGQSPKSKRRTSTKTLPKPRPKPRPRG